MWVLCVQGPSAGAEELSEESIGVSCPTSQPTHLAMVFDLSPFQVPYTTFLKPRQPDFYLLSFHNNWGLTAFTSWGKAIRHHPAMLRRCREKHQCIFAYGLEASTVVNRNHFLWPGQSTGILGRQGVWGLRCWWGSLLVTLSSLSHPPILFFPSSSPLTFPPFLSFFFSFFSLSLFFFISWRLITLQYCSGFCHTLTWISHGSSLSFIYHFLQNVNSHH